MPYWRLALQHCFGVHYAEIGTYGMTAQVYPGAIKSFGTDGLTDVAFDATYQYLPGGDFSLSGYANYIYEDRNQHASHMLIGANAFDRLNTLRLTATASYLDTFTLDEQYFSINGTTDDAVFFPNGSPNSVGWITEIDYSPGGKPDSLLPDWINVKLSLQYVAYDEFNGTSRHASDNNTLYGLVWIAWTY